MKVQCLPGFLARASIIRQEARFPAELLRRRHRGEAALAPSLAIVLREEVVRIPAAAAEVELAAAHFVRVVVPPLRVVVALAGDRG